MTTQYRELTERERTIAALRELLRDLDEICQSLNVVAKKLEDLK